VNRRKTGAAALVLALHAGPASAHLVSTGLGPVYDGIAHFATAPEEFLPMGALALLAGLRGPAQSRAVVFMLPLAWMLASQLSPMPAGVWSTVGPALALLAAGSLLALDANLSPRLASMLAVIFGTLLGLFYRASVGDNGLADPPQVLGAVVFAFVLLALLASLSLPLHRGPAKIAVRTAGSWMGALGLLLVGWWFHGRP
jgi:hypothetical protein